MIAGYRDIVYTLGTCSVSRLWSRDMDLDIWIINRQRATCLHHTWAIATSLSSLEQLVKSTCQVATLYKASYSVSHRYLPSTSHLKIPSSPSDPLGHSLREYEVTLSIGTLPDLSDTTSWRFAKDYVSFYIGNPITLCNRIFYYCDLP